ncbi:unnamed protein product [Ectocarpus sp. CCAP 1310/34]|nr:unnamed protein product [Ectocarpus sp. CCAP 1310/34]
MLLMFRFYSPARPLFSQKRPCSSQTCVACNICMVGFKLVGTTQKPYARYGRGLYFSSVSGKSNDYADGSEQVTETTCPCRLTCTMVTGRTQPLRFVVGSLPPAFHADGTLIDSGVYS